MAVIEKARDLWQVIIESEKDIDRFNQELKGERAVVSFMASWCSPCVNMVDSLADRYLSDVKEFLEANRIIPVYVDVDGSRKLVVENEVRNVPQSIAFEQGERIDCQPGYVGGPHFVEWLQKAYHIE